MFVHDSMSIKYWIVVVLLISLKTGLYFPVVPKVGGAPIEGQIVVGGGGEF